MPDVRVRNGGAPVDSTILVNTDGESIAGDGSIDHPIRTVDGGTSVSSDDATIGGNGTTNPLHTIGGGGPSFLPTAWETTSWETPSDQVMYNTTESGGVVAPFNGAVVGISCWLKQAITEGTLTVAILADNVAIAEIVLTTGSPTFVTFPVGEKLFTAGQLLTLELDASADQTPSSSIDAYVAWRPNP